MGNLLAVDGHGDDRVFHGREADKGAVVRAAGGVLRGAGLGADRYGEGADAVRIFPAAEVLSGGAAQLGDDLAHTPHIHIVGLPGDIHGGDDFRLILQDQFPIVGGYHAV